MGLVTRARSAQSSREVVVALSAKAETLMDKLVPVARNLERTAIAGVPKAELAAAKRALARVYENVMPGASGSRADRRSLPSSARRERGPCPEAVHLSKQDCAWRPPRSGQEGARGKRRC